MASEYSPKAAAQGSISLASETAGDLYTTAQLTAKKIIPSFREPEPPARGDKEPPLTFKRRKLLDDLADQFTPRMTEIRLRRRQIDEDDLRAHAAWRGVRTRFYYDSEQFRHYLPIARRVVERFVVRVVQQLVPVGDFFEVYPGDELDLAKGQQAEALRGYMSYLLTHRLRIRGIVSMLSRSLALYRRAIAKVGVELTDAMVMGPNGKAAQLRQVWPTFRAVDPLAFYVWPETAGRVPEDAELMFEDVMVPWSQYAHWMDQGLTQPIDRRDLGPPEWPYHMKQRLSLAGLTEPTVSPALNSAVDGFGGTQPKTGSFRLEPFVALSEVWFRSASQWLQAWVVWNVNPRPRTVRLQAKTFPQPPLLMTIARPIVNEHYTHSIMSDVEPLQITLNDQWNQAEEARSIAAIPPIGMNSNLLGRMDSYVFGSRKKWVVNGDPRQAIMVMPIPDTSGVSQKAMQMTLSLIQGSTPSGPIMEGQTQRNMPRAGYAVNNLISLGMADLEDSAKQIEEDILTPALKMIHTVTVLFVPKSQLLAIPGTDALAPMTLTVEDLYGGWMFRWVGSLQKQNEQVKAQQMLMFVQGLARLAPVLQQQGWAINWGVLLKRVWRESLGERGLESIIIPLTELAKINPAAAMMMDGMMAGGGQPGGGGPPGGGGAPGPAQGTNGGAPVGQVDLERMMGRTNAGGGAGQGIPGLGG